MKRLFAKFVAVMLVCSFLLQSSAGIPHVFGDDDMEPPTQPANVVVAGKTETSIMLSWDNSTDDVGIAGYDIYLGETWIGSVANVTYVVYDLVPNTKYFFTVKARDAAGNRSPASSILVVTTLPHPPLDLRATAVFANVVELSWTTPPIHEGIAGYDIYVDGVIAGSTIGDAVYAVNRLAAGTTYRFTVKTRDAEGNESQVGNEAVVTTLDDEADIEAPSAPANVVSPQQTSTSVKLNWVAATDNVAVTGYQVYRDGSPVGTTTATTYTVYGLSNQVTYHFAVSTLDAANNESEPSETISVTTYELLPAVQFTVLTGTYQMPTKLDLQRPAIEWQQNAESGSETIEAYRIRVLNGDGASSLIDSGIILHDSEQTTDSWTVSANLPVGLKMQAIIQVYDGQLWSDWSPPAWFMVDIPSRSKTYTYDRLNRISGVSYESGQRLRFTYDRGGNITKVDSALNYHITGDIVIGTADPHGVTVTVYGDGFSYAATYNSVTDNVYGKTGITDAPNMNDRVRYAFDLPMGTYTIVISGENVEITRTVTSSSLAVLQTDYGFFNFVVVSDVMWPPSS
ncbi:fibronectin type III domain-containing protein [Paenibacillus cymbidii]|uniref:fibronectin type III domain-containing protein n=1 Tax=Paenibacillus cymbidii TaxID=1639034 RepID=UPI00108012C2|nr:fibronectin type III domain-containing protein [Paenibacillus cymbidii]